MYYDNPFYYSTSSLSIDGYESFYMRKFVRIGLGESQHIYKLSATRSVIVMINWFCNKLLVGWRLIVMNNWICNKLLVGWRLIVMNDWICSKLLVGWRLIVMNNWICNKLLVGRRLIVMND